MPHVRLKSVLFTIALAGAAIGLDAGAQSPGPSATDASVPVRSARVRGMIERIAAHGADTQLTIRARNGDVLQAHLADNAVITEVVLIELSAIQAGSFIGTAAMPGADGTLVALEVHVFPESMRGTGEGHRPFDLQPDSTMTNATVADVVSAPRGRTLRLRYKDGEKTVQVPEGTSVVTFRPADRSLLKAGTQVIVSLTLSGETLTATRISAGRDGYTPPM